MNNKWEDDEEVQRFVKYLQIPSVHPDVDYDDCVKYLKELAEQMGLPVTVHEFVPKKPVVIVTWTGTEPGTPSILLNSHMDVVPVSEKLWTHPPFSAHITEDGWLYARGAQDMKSVGMIHLEAVRRLQCQGVRLKRTVHISFVPDEEIGGEVGMKIFSESEVFRNMNIGFEMDESAPSYKPDILFAFYGERTCRQIKVRCGGKPTHGSLIESGTAGEKIHFMIAKFMKLREEENQKWNKQLESLGEVSTFNLTKLEGGCQVNVMPESLTAYFDIRLAPQVILDEFDKMLKGWCAEAGEDVSFEYLVEDLKAVTTNIENNPFYDALVEAAADVGLKLNCVICPGTTDARYVRQQGVPAINLTPIANTPLAVHCHDEKLRVEEYKRGIGIMVRLLTGVANV